MWAYHPQIGFLLSEEVVEQVKLGNLFVSVKYAYLPFTHTQREYNALKVADCYQNEYTMFIREQ